MERAAGESSYSPVSGRRLDISFVALLQYRPYSTGAPVLSTRVSVPAHLPLPRSNSAQMPRPSKEAPELMGRGMAWFRSRLSSAYDKHTSGFPRTGRE